MFPAAWRHFLLQCTINVVTTKRRQKWDSTLTGMLIVGGNIQAINCSPTFRNLKENIFAQDGIFLRIHFS